MSALKRILTIIGFLLVTIGLGYLMYAVFFRPQLPGPPAEPTPTAGGLPHVGGNVNASRILTTNGRLPASLTTPTPSPALTPIVPTASAIANGGLTRTTEYLTTGVQQPTLAPDGVSLLYYDPRDGRFFRSSPEGTITPFNDRSFHSVQQVTWAEDRRRAVLEYPDGANIIYDFTTGKQTTLPRHWEAFDFAPGGNQLVGKSIGLEPENRWLVVADAGSGGVKTVAALGENAPSVRTDWSPNGQIIALQVETQGIDRQEIFPIGLNQEQFHSLVVPGWGFEGQWTPDGRQLLYSVHSSRQQSKPELWVADATPETIGANRRDLGLQTWARKCAFAGATTAYCAVPQTLPTGAGLFPAETDASADRLYRVDLDSGSTTLVAEPDADHTMRDLLVTRDGQHLYYTARQDGKVYRIQLK